MQKMISIIICSRTADIQPNIKENIRNTIGVEYELVVIDNSQNRYSIFSAYNEGVKRAKYPYLCFMHDDVLCFHTQNWGLTIIKHFEDDTVGLVSFAGTHFLPSIPVYWYTLPFISEHNLTNDNGNVIECIKINFFKDKREVVDVVACDGFCFFMRKEIFQKISFDENTYSGFHFYDMDICMQVLDIKQRIVVCNDILIEHFWSESAAKTKKGMNYFDINRQLFFNKWENNFPIWRGIDDIPEYSLIRINNLYKEAQVRHSKVYRIGKLILRPLNFIKSKIRI